jgi:hypothetical protein
LVLLARSRSFSFSWRKAAKRVAGVKSEVLLLAANTNEGSVLIGPDRETENGVAVR